MFACPKRLPLLLQESISGSASTACFVCLSQAPDNAQSSKTALDFGEVFSKLKTQPRRNRPMSRAVMLANAPRRGGGDGGSGGGGGNRYAILADARGRDREQLRRVLEGFTKDPNEAAPCSRRTLTTRKKEMEEEEDDSNFDSSDEYESDFERESDASDSEKEEGSSTDEIPEQYRHK